MVSDVVGSNSYEPFCNHWEENLEEMLEGMQGQFSSEGVLIKVGRIYTHEDIGSFTVLYVDVALIKHLHHHLLLFPIVCW